MNYQLNCQCGKKLVVSRSQAGQEVECSCGEKIPIPTLRGLALLPLVDDPSVLPASATSTQVAESSWKGWRGVMLSMLALVGVIALSLGARYIFLRLQVDTSYTEEVERQASHEMIDNMPIEGLVASFEDFRKHGLGMKSSPPFLLIQAFAKQCERNATICGVIALAAAAAGAAIVVTRPRRKQKLEDRRARSKGPGL